jgi:hypothetical protein
MPQLHPFDETISHIVPVNGTNPGAGNNFTYTFPVAQRINLFLLRFRFVTDATAVDRYPHVSLRVGGDSFGYFPPEFPAVPSTTYQYTFADSAVPFHAAAPPGNRICQPLGHLIILPTLASFQILIDAIAGADVIDQIYFLYRAWNPPEYAI